MSVEEVSESFHGDEADTIFAIELAVVSELVGVFGNGSNRIVDLSSHFKLLGAMLMIGRKTTAAIASTTASRRVSTAE